MRTCRGAESPLRVLQVVGGGMERGGAETWLMHVLRKVDRRRFAMDFLVHTNRECAYDEEIAALGSRVIPCVHPMCSWHSRPWQYPRFLQRLLEEHGPYDLVHSHVGLKSGYVLRSAAAARVPCRLSHAHHDIAAAQSAGSGVVSERPHPLHAVMESRPVRSAYVALMTRWIDRYATCGLACSARAAESLYGPAWTSDPRWQTLYCAIPLTSFGERVERSRLRAELGLPADSLVLGHVGSFRSDQKNHRFLIQIAREIADRLPNARLLLVGEGPLRSQVEQQAHAAGLQDVVVFLGSRGDVARLMLGAMDVFVLPSLYEGLPLVLLEAQAAGLLSVYSDTITTEVEIVKPLCHRLSLEQPAAYWAEAILRSYRQGPPVGPAQALAEVEASAFNIEWGVEHLCRLYAECRGKVG